MLVKLTPARQAENMFKFSSWTQTGLKVEVSQLHDLAHSISESSVRNMNAKLDLGPML